MLVDGKRIAEDIFQEIKNRVKELDNSPHLTVFTCLPNFATQKYLDLKRQKAQEVGIDMEVVELTGDITTPEAVELVKESSAKTNGIVVQLPLPTHLELSEIINAIPLSLDVDGMHYLNTEGGPIHPVAGAIAKIAATHDVHFAGQTVVVVGQGRLVGQPAALWAAGQEAIVTTLARDTENNSELIKNADILILGAGEPGLITPDMVKEGVVIFDAGTSELGGKLSGDADPDCAKVASLFTPVPGGIGPITVAILLNNVLESTIAQNL